MAPIGVMAPIALWCAIVTAVALVPSVIALFARRWRLGGWLIAATVLPVAGFMGLVYQDLLRIAGTYPAGHLAREAPWGGMGGLVLLLPAAWCAFMLLAGASLVTIATLRSRAQLAE